MSNDIRVSDPNGSFIFDALTFKKDTSSIQTNDNPIKEDLNQSNSIQNDEHLSGLNHNTGRIPSNSISFDENNDDILSPLETLDNTQKKSNINNSNDPDDLPFLDFNVPNENEEIPNEPTNKKNHSTGKMVVHLEAHLLKTGLNKLATNIIARNTTKAVTKELTEVLAKTAVKSSTKSGTTMAVKLVEGATLGTAKTVASVTGKGVATLTVKEVAKSSGSIVKGLETSAKAAGEILFKDGATKVISNTGNALVKTSIGAGEKALQLGLEKGTEAAVKKIISKTPELATKTASKTFEKTVANATAKATTEAAAKGSSKAASKLSAAIPWIGTAIGVGITAWDTADAIKKSKDPNVSTVSKALAWTTVGLDAVSTATVATGVGAPIGWVASGLSIGTSILSDYLK
jgi:hypothetical protein